MNWKVIKEVGFPIAVAVFLVQGFMGLFKYLIKERNETTQGEIQEAQNNIKELVQSNQDTGERIAEANAELGQRITDSNQELAERLSTAILESSEKNSKAIQEMARAVGQLEGQRIKRGMRREDEKHKQEQKKKGHDFNGRHNKKLFKT